MIQDLLNSSSDGHKVTSASSSLGAFTGMLANSSGNASVIGNITRVSGGTGSVCGWDDPYVSYPANPCADIVFPSVAVTAAIIAGVTEWYLTLTFTFASATPYCNNIWEFSFSQTGPAPVNSGGLTITLDYPISTTVYNVRIYPSYAHSPHFLYNYTITSCCGSIRNGTVSV